MAQRMWCLLTEAATEMRLDHTLRNGQTFTWTRLPPNLVTLPFAYSSYAQLLPSGSCTALRTSLPSKIEVMYFGALQRHPLLIAQTHNACYYCPLPTLHIGDISNMASFATRGVEDPLDASSHSECIHCLVETYFQVHLPHTCNIATGVDRLLAESALNSVTSTSTAFHAPAHPHSPISPQVPLKTTSDTRVSTSSPTIASSSTTFSPVAPSLAVTPPQAEPQNTNTSHTHTPPLRRGAPAKTNTSLASLYALWAYNDYYTYCRASAISGVRILRQPVGECTVEFICSANNHLQRITAMVQKIAKEWGQELGMLILMKNPDAENIVANLEMAYARAKGYPNHKEKEVTSENPSDITDSEFRVSSVSGLSLGQAHVSHISGRAHEIWGKSVVNGVVGVPDEENLDNKGKRKVFSGGKQTMNRKQKAKKDNDTDAAALTAEGSGNTVHERDVALEHGLSASWEWIWVPALPFPEEILGNSEDARYHSGKVYYPWLPTPSENTITIPLYSFPESKDLGNLQEDVMRNSGFGYRAKYLQESGKIMSQEGWEENIYSEGEAAWEKTLQQLESGDITLSGKPISGKKQKKPKIVRVGNGSTKPPGNGIKEESLVGTQEASGQTVKQKNTSLFSSSFASVTSSSLSSSPSSPSPSPVSTHTSMSPSLSPHLAHLRQRVIGESHAHSLMRLPGVGRKVADCIRLFALGDTDAIPVDTHVLGTALGRHASAIAWCMCRVVVEAEEREEREKENLRRKNTEERVVVKKEEEGMEPGKTQYGKTTEKNTYSGVSSATNIEAVPAAGFSSTATAHTASVTAPAASCTASMDSSSAAGAAGAAGAASTSGTSDSAAGHNVGHASDRNDTGHTGAGDGGTLCVGDVPREYSRLPRLLDIARRVCSKAGLLAPNNADTTLTNATNAPQTHISVPPSSPSALTSTPASTSTSTSTARAVALDDDSDATEPEVIVDKKRKKIGKNSGVSGKTEKFPVPEHLPDIYHGLWRALDKLYGNVWVHASYHIPSLADLCGPYDTSSLHPNVRVGRCVGSNGVKQEPIDYSSSQDTHVRDPIFVQEPERSEKAAVTCLNLPYPKNPQTVYQLLTGVEHEIPCPIATIAEAKEVGANAVYEGINEFYRELWGDKCGWAHSVLFTGELSVHKQSQKGAKQ